MPIAPATLFAPQPMWSTRRAVAGVVAAMFAWLVITRCVNSSTFRLHAVEGFIDLLVALFAALLQARVGARLQELKLFLNLLVILKAARRQRAFTDGGFHGAIRLAFVAAIRKATRRRQFFDVGKAIGQ